MKVPITEKTETHLCYQPKLVLLHELQYCDVVVALSFLSPWILRSHQIRQDAELVSINTTVTAASVTNETSISICRVDDQGNNKRNDGGCPRNLDMVLDLRWVNSHEKYGHNSYRNAPLAMAMKSLNAPTNRETSSGGPLATLT